MNRRWRRAALAAWMAASVAAPAAAEPPTLADVLARAGAAVIELQQQLSGIVAEEDYVQDVHRLGLGTRAANILPAVTHRELKSDLLLVRPVGANRWMQFRDVFDVDRRPVRDRSERLMKLFVSPTSSTASQAELIAAESSRYNIGNIQRTLNVPLLSLAILEPRNQPRFGMKIAKGDAPVRSAAAAMRGVWVVEYREVEPRTIIRTTGDRDMPSHGRFWIDPETGHVLASELIAEDLTIHGTIAVGYDLEPTLRVMVPIEMQERYDVYGDRSRVSGTATYGKFRQFQVKVDERIAPIR